MEINFDVKFCKSTTYAAEDCIDLLIIFDGDFIKIIARIWPAITIILLKICYHACSQDYEAREEVIAAIMPCTSMSNADFNL